MKQYTLAVARAAIKTNRQTNEVKLDLSNTLLVENCLIQRDPEVFKLS